MLNPTMSPILLAQDDGAEPDATDQVLKLQRRTADALAGYRTMVEKADPAFRPVAERFCDLHNRHNNALTAMLVRFGQEPEADGTFMATINQAIISMRALFDDIDDGIMDNIRSGENHVLEGFDEAIDDAGLAPGDRQELRDMRDELTLVLQDTRDLNRP